MDLKTLSYKINQPIASIKLRGEKVYLFALKIKDISAISQLNSEDTSAEKFKSILRIIASNKEPSKTNPERILLAEDFIDSLSEVELNKVAQIYLETPVVKNIKEELKIPLQKNTGEADIQYLQRLISMYVADFNEKQKETISKIDPFRNVREASLSLSEKINSYDFSSHAVEQSRTSKNQRLRELEMARVTAVMTKESTNLLNKLAIGVTDFLDIWKKETQNNNWTTTLQLWIAAVSLALSVILSSVALFYSYKSYKQDMISDEANNKIQLEAIKLLSESNKNINTLARKNSNLEYHIAELIKVQNELQQKLQIKSKEHAKSLSP